MHIDGVPNRASRPTWLLRKSYREGDQVGIERLVLVGDRAMISHASAPNAGRLPALRRSA